MSNSSTTVFGSKQMLRELELSSKKLRKLAGATQVNRAAAKALNDTARIHQTTVKKQTAKKVDIPQKFIHRKIKLKRASSKYLVTRVTHHSGGVSIMVLNKKASLQMHLEARRMRQTGRRGHISEIRYKKYQWDNAFSQKYKGRNIIFHRRKGTQYPIAIPKVSFEQQLMATAKQNAPIQAKLITQRFKRDMDWRIQQIMSG